MNAARCRKCGDTIESKHRHDFVTCKCGAISLDGGGDYQRAIGNRDDFEFIGRPQKADETNHPGGGSRPVPAPSGSRAPGPGTTRKRPFAVHRARAGTWHIYGPDGRLADFFQLESFAAVRCDLLNDTYEAGYDAGHRDAEPCDGCGAAEGVGCSPWCEFHPDKTRPRQGEA